ncbi:hypothetical protein ACFWWC_21670 [Streptomyces sp. NPDC058642]|uniref:hypothetical protein n=1 Tax=Streptomyces sp. NPDC058642 TaxID=3346572 RepID=UPI0036694D95
MCGSGLASWEDQPVAAEEVVRALRAADPVFIPLLTHFVAAADGPALLALRDELVEAAVDVLPGLS